MEVREVISYAPTTYLRIRVIPELEVVAQLRVLTG